MERYTLAQGRYGAGATDWISLSNPQGILVVKGGFDAPLPEQGAGQREIKLNLSLAGPDPEKIAYLYTELLTMLREAERQHTPITFSAYVSGVLIWFDVYGGSLEASGDALATLASGYLRGAILTLQCEEYGRAQTKRYDFLGPIVSGMDASIFLRNVPGDAPALTRVTLTDTSIAPQHINRVHITGASAHRFTQTDFDPFVKPSAATLVTDGSDYSGDGFARINANASWQTIASAIVPSNRYRNGLADIFLRIRDSETPLSAPSPVYTPHDGVAVSVVASAVSSGAADSATINWPATTPDGVQLFLIVGWDHADVASISSVSGDWTSAASKIQGTIGVALYYLANATPTSGDVTVTLTSAANINLHLGYVEAATSIGSVVTNGGSYLAGAPYPFVSISPASDSPGAALVAAVADVTADTTHVTSGYILAADIASGPLKSYVEVQVSKSLASQMVMELDSAPSTFAAVAIHFRANSNYFGSLTGNYDLALVARNGATASAPSLIQTVQVNGEGIISVTVPSDPTVTSYDMYIRPENGQWTVDQNVPYTSFDITSIGLATDFPSASASAVAKLRMRFGLSANDAQASDLVVSPALMNGTWEWVYYGTLNIPPIPALMDGAPPDCYLDIQALHESLTPTIDVDLIFAPLHSEPQAQAATQDGALAMDGLKWIFETLPNGSAFAYLANGDTPYARLNSDGAFMVMPGDNIISIRTEGVDGVSNVREQRFALSIAITPRYRSILGTP